MKTVITIHDASVLIDLYDLDLLEVLFETDFQLITTDFVFYEELQMPEYIDDLEEYFEVVSQSESQLEQIYDLFNEISYLSVQDVSVLIESESRGGVLCSNDRRLRETAAARGVEVHGTLWIISNMIEQNLISRDFAIEKLEILLSSNPRSPRKEIEKLITEISDAD